ncbi:MAG: FAD-binding oxidoreductase [Vicinamibacterales bacterium]
MHEITFRQLDGGETAVPRTRVSALSDRLAGDALEPGQPGFRDARTVWNAMIDRHPALITRCATADDVAEAVRFAHEQELLVSVRGGGHNIAGNAVCEGGLMIDLSPMRDVEVQVADRAARVGPGALLQDVDAATQAHGLATPVGYNSTTGIAGLTLGGGFGWLSRSLGLTIDNLLGADVVTADGVRVRATPDEHPDLFWGLRGGGGNFGVVTNFQFRLHPVGPEVLSGVVVYPLAQAAAALRHVRDFNAAAPDDVTCWAVLRKAPPLPFLDPAVHGTDVLVVAACCAGDMREAARTLAPMRGFGAPHADAIAPHPYAGFQQAFDALNAHGARNYWKTHNFAELPDEAIDAIVEAAAHLPSAETEIALARLGGAVARVPVEATAYPHRGAAWVMNLHTRWTMSADDERCTAWARDLHATLGPWAMGGAYANFITDPGRAREAYRGNWERLVALKSDVDPDNLFRMNQNVPPMTH